MQTVAQMRFFSVIFSLAVLVFAAAADARIRHRKWEVAYQFKSPDCYRKYAVIVNGTIHAEQGDLVVVEVKNGLVTESTAAHWHGIRQIETPYLKIMKVKNGFPGNAFICKLMIDRPAGTHIYYCGCGMQRFASLHGPVVVSICRRVVEPFAYDSDRSIVLDDLWRKSTQEQPAGLSFILPIDKSILTGGKCKLDCTDARHSTNTCNMTNSTCSTHVMTVVHGKTYLLRISSIIESSEPMVLEMEGHNMTVVKANGHHVEPLVVTNLKIHSGETYSVLVKADQDAAWNYWVSLVVEGQNPSTTPTGVAIFNHCPNDPGRLPTSTPQVDGQVLGSAQSIFPSRKVIEDCGFAFMNLFPVMCFNLYVFVKLRRG